MIHPQAKKIISIQNKILKKKNKIDKNPFQGVFKRYVNPVLTDKHVPIDWIYDLNQETNPFFLERLGINAVFNSGAILFQGKYCLMARVEGKDRKSFFAIARSSYPDHGFVFDSKPILLDEDKEETNVYDMRLTLHEDGSIYGIYCSESKDLSFGETDTEKASAKAKVIRTKDLEHFEFLGELKTPSPQQRNVTIHPEFVNQKYLFYTRPQDGFIYTGKGGGIAYGFVDSIEHLVIEEEHLLDEKKYHTIYEVKNGEGPSPIKTSKGWIHIAHGVRNTASGLRYVLYAFATSLEDPTKIIAKPSGYLLAPQDEEYVGDVSNVLFSNGVIVNQLEEVYLYYASSDTRLHVAKTTLPQLMDYVFQTPKEVFQSRDSVIQRIELIDKNKQVED